MKRKECRGHKKQERETKNKKEICSYYILNIYYGVEYDHWTAHMTTLNEHQSIAL